MNIEIEATDSEGRKEVISRPRTVPNARNLLRLNSSHWLTKGWVSLRLLVNGTQLKNQPLWTL